MGKSRILKWRPEAIIRNASVAMTIQMEKAGALLVADMQAEVNRGNPTGLTPSLPGEPPRKVSGDLQRSIEARFSGVGSNQHMKRLRMWAGSWIAYARRLELGFTGSDSMGRVYDQAPRPFIVPVWRRNRDKLMRILKVKRRR